MREKKIKVGEGELILRQPNGAEVVRIFGKVRKKFPDGASEEEYVSEIILNLGPFVSYVETDKEIGLDEILFNDACMLPLLEFSGEIMARVGEMFKKKK